VLRVTLDGEINVLIAFDNIVPTGLEVSGNTVYMAEAGPDPHALQTGKVVSFEPKSPTATEVASGAPFLLDDLVAAAVSTPSRTACSTRLPTVRCRTPARWSRSPPAPERSGRSTASRSEAASNNCSITRSQRRPWSY
jgi:hypothetical protein